jgi:hypothetical protein|tara:strand:- start:89 stop:379 length:291 start_codon:yes stop_codon:yes gene_type:complete
MIDYSTHTEHYSRADNFTYNYKVIDDAISECYNKGFTIQQIADALREPFSRVAYRISLLQSKGMVDYKLNTTRAHLTRTYFKLRKDLQEVETKLKG